jgi:hypothetical protein
VEAAGLELLSPGPDGNLGTADDVRDPFARVVPAGTPYAVASGEDALMAALSRSTPGENGLWALLADYRRVEDEMLEEATGDAVTPFGRDGALGVNPENALGLLMGNQIGDSFGYGSLGLRGTGRGGGGEGRGTVGLGSLGALVRERFPATLRFVPEAVLAASGRTTIEVPLSEAVTTYVVEAILWTRGGWVWSDATTVRVDQDVVVDAPVPAIATVGDRLRLPLRVAARTAAAQRVRIRGEGSAALALAPFETGELQVPGGDAREALVELALSVRGEGQVTVAALAPDGHALDATRRPIRVLDDARRVRDEAEAVIDGRGALSLSVPAGALARGAGSATIAVGPSLFGAPERGEHPARDTWVAALAGWPSRGGGAGAVRAGSPGSVGAGWSNPAVADADLDEAMQRIAAALVGDAPESASRRMDDAAALLQISPAIRRAGDRVALRGRLLELAGRLRGRVEEAAALSADTPWLWAAQAAALLWSAPEGARNARALELVRRLRRAVVEVGDDVWLEGGAGEAGDRLIGATALLALCELRLGDRDQAFRLVRTAARLATAAGGGMPEARALESLDRTWAQAAAAALVRGRPVASVTLRVDGEARRVDLAGGVAEVPLDALGRPGDHRVEVDAPEGAVVLLRLRAEYGLPWSVTPPPSDRGPLSLSITGETGGLDGRAALRLEVRNTAPRLVSAPVVEIDLPAGAELDEGARQAIAARSARPPDFSGRTLTVALRPLRPGAVAVVELPVRWSVAGRMRGLGAVGYGADRPEAVTVLPSREVRVDDPRE